MSPTRAGFRAEASRARRDQILKAGLGLFLERGVGATTVGELLERSGSSIGSFYHHFSGKADVAATLYVETLDRYKRTFLSEVGKHGRPRDGIEAAVRWHVRWTAGNPELATYLAHCREPEVTALSEATVQQVNQTFYEHLWNWLTPHFESGAIKKLPADIFFALWMGPATEFTRLWLMSRERNPRRLTRAENVLSSAGWNALRVEDPKPLPSEHQEIASAGQRNA
jgi:AcrR family transcriptional regulator